jgi:DNA-binding beta-propeller fold protein YncE
MNSMSLPSAARLAAVLTAGILAGVTNAAFGQAVLPTGATITPTATPGSVFQPLTVALPDYPNYSPDSAETTAISPDGKTLLILTSGYNLNLDSNGNFQPQDSSEYVFVYDISSPSLPLKRQVVLVPNAFGGLVWSPDGSRFYVAGGQDDNVHTYAQQNGLWSEVGSPINLGHTGDLMSKETFVGPTAAGLGITTDGTTVVVANFETDSITVVDVINGKVLSEFDLRPGLINPAQTGVPGGEFPVGVAIKGNDTIYVSSARDREIDVLHLSGGEVKLTNRIPVDGNPGKIILNKAQTELFVTANNSDALIAIDTASNSVVTQVNTTAPADYFEGGKSLPKGSNPNSVTLSSDEKTAYVTNGGTNNVAVISLMGKAKVKGLIPTGWQPNSVSVSSNGLLYVVNGKSVQTPNPLNCRFINAGGNYGSACNSVQAQNGSGNQYAWQNMKASLLTVPLPKEDDDLEDLTALVARNNGFNLRLSEQETETMQFLKKHIEHVIYIVKENRTFDQVLGDLTNGANADPTLTQFPSFNTPNFHNFANNFVTFDNFYDSGVVSMDGWQWSTAARALDLNEKSVVINYGKGGANYDSEGTARNVNVARVGVAARKAWQPLYPNDPNLLPGTANEVAADGPNGEQGLGYLWDSAIRAKLSVRNYGFFLDLGAVQGLDPTLTDPCSQNPPVQVAFPAHTSLLDRTDFCFRGFDQSFPDFFRYLEWAREFDQQVETNTFPNLTLLRLNHDHFGSFGSASFGVNTPELQMADNDYSVGLVAEKIARSPYANNTLIFVIEDDPQDGADHVSGERSLAFIIGPYLKQKAVVSAHYATVNMLRTIEDVLGIETLGVHDAGVPPMAEAFDTTKANWTYSAVPAPILFTSTLPLVKKQVKNGGQPDALPRPTHDAAWWEARTKGFDFSAEDRIDSEKFNRILWEGLMGDKPYPTARSGADLRHGGTPQPETRQVGAKDKAQ